MNYTTPGFFALKLLGTQAVREAHLIPILHVAEINDFVNHGWELIGADHIPDLLNQHHLIPADRLSGLHGYPVFTRRS